VLINPEEWAWQIQTRLMIFCSHFTVSVWHFLSNQYSGIRGNCGSLVYSYGYYSAFFEVQFSIALQFWHTCNPNFKTLGSNFSFAVFHTFSN